MSKLGGTLAIRALLGFGSGCIGGAIFKGLDFPLPWMLGSLTAAAIIAVAGLDWKLPSAARNAARPIIGVMAGSAFTAEVARSMVDWWEAILPLLSFLVLIPWLAVRSSPASAASTRPRPTSPRPLED